MKNFLSLSLLALVAVGCDDLGSVPVTLEVENAFSLTSVDERTMNFEVGDTIEVEVDKEGSKIIMNINGEEFAFRGARFSSSDESITSKPSRSGQETADGEGIGFKVRRVLSELLDSDTIHYSENCTYYTTHRHTHCSGHGHHRHCWHETVRVPHRGSRHVEETTTKYVNRFEGSLFGRHTGDFAKAVGEKITQKTRRYSSSCR